MNLNVLALIVTFMFTAETSRPEYIARSTKVARICDRVVLAIGQSGQSQFSLQRAEQLAREFYSESADQCYLMRFTYGGNGKDVTCSTGKPFTEHMSRNPSALWRRLYVEERPTSPVVRMIALKDRAILQASLADGIEERILVGHNDPTWLTLGNSRFRLLHFAVDALQHYGETVSHFYLRSPDALSDEDGALLTHRLLELAGTDSVKVDVKNDSWFQLAGPFPAIYRFEDNELSRPWGPTPFWLRLLPTFLLRPGPSVLRKSPVMTCTAQRERSARCYTYAGE